MTGIAAVNALERLEWRCEAPGRWPIRMNETEESAAHDGRCLDRRAATELGSNGEKGTS
jgi:hypothetical protein